MAVKNVQEVLKVKPQAWEPAPYQVQGMKFLLEHMEAGLFLQPGLRKTSISLGAYKILKKKNLVKKVLVIAPLRVCYSVWPKEIEKWKDFSHITYEVLHGTKKDAALQREADMYFINPEGLGWLFGVTSKKVEGKKKRMITYDLTQFKKLGIDLLICDEASLFKHQNSERFQIIKPLLDSFKCRWALTGSPATNGLLDLFGVMYLIDQGKSLGKYITHYRNAFFTPSGYGGYVWSLQPDGAKRIYARIAPCTFSLSDKDLIKLPKLIENIVKVELPPKVRKTYDELEKQFITEIEGKTITAVNAGVASGKCRQVANGGLYFEQAVDDEGRKPTKRTWTDLHQEKIEAVKDLVEELNGAQVIIAYDFEHDLARLLKAFGKDTPVIGGKVSAAKSDLICAAWNRGEIPVLLAHPAAIAYGLNLQDGNAQHIIWHSLTWNFELFDQLIKRLHRSGNKAAKVFIHFIIAKNTLDEAILIALRKKNRVQGDLMSAIQEYTKARKLAKHVAATKIRKL